MKKLLLMLMIGIISLPALAMASPEFSGSWTLDSANSDPAPSMYWLTRASTPAIVTRAGTPTMGGRRFRQEVIMNVHQDANSIQVSQAQTLDRSYTLDGQPHTIATDTGIQKAVVTAEMQGDNLVIETAEPYGGMPGNATLHTKEVWSLSPDGKTLTITTTRDVPAKQETIKQVYNRTEAQPEVICSDGCVTVH